MTVNEPSLGQRKPEYMTPERKAAIKKVVDDGAKAILEGMPFHNRGFSELTLKALVANGIDYPERLLFMTAEQLREIPGIGKVSLEQINDYRARFQR